MTGSPERAATRLLIVDDQRLVREGIASLVSLEPGIEVVGTAADGAEAVRIATERRPDVVLMDVRMPGMDGVTAAAELRDDTRVIMLTTFDDDEYVIQALRAGACGYLLKDLPAPELAQAVRLAHAGVDQYAPAISTRLAGMLRGRSPSPSVSLTGRELDVLRLIATGAANREIARTLFVSEGTVKNHVSNILSQLDVRDRTQAAIYALDHGLV
ncbi:response regulator [Luteipulveratus mongoliensis]|uniref:LuxR family transcriptional regulator n=1 Tax=Luteipulveratus mongoliensis TaxID=571913 RepID=A0A0K1JNY3_9MICO|nr:response regulator transcription factor [Luteipulveratus mongoliensis]AKU18427.1 LuxR family transcriptional regulator [Luteipulveratus mongoliensis]